ncbi:hypothetical protein WA577_007119, partial [Blastocystis sp. JDR]
MHNTLRFSSVFSMQGAIGFLVSIVSSEGIPKGCYSVSIQYRNSTVNLGHMRKNRKVHCSAFFSTKSMDSISLRKNDLLIQLYRGEHKISSKFPFATYTIPSKELRHAVYQSPRSVLLSVLQPAFSSCQCSLSIRIQTIFPKSSFSIPFLLQKERHVPSALQLTIKKAELQNHPLQARSYCVLIFENMSVLKTEALPSDSPYWNHSVIANDAFLMSSVSFTVNVFRETDMLDELIGSGVLVYNPKNDRTGSVVSKECSIFKEKECVGKVVFEFTYLYCCTECAAPEENDLSSSVSSIASRSLSQTSSEMWWAPTRSIPPRNASFSPLGQSRLHFLQAHDT